MDQPTAFICGMFVEAFLGSISVVAIWELLNRAERAKS